MGEVSLYIHIPFCRAKCYYCDFLSFSSEMDLAATYMEALNQEVKSYKELLSGQDIGTIFIGGGTPSAIDPRHIYGLMETINKNFKLGDQAEISMESNPGTLTREKVNIYRQSGINRISMGAQTFKEELLTRIGRIHKEADIYRSIDLLRQGGFENINLDLMTGLPGQDLEDVEDSLKKAIDLDIEHISSYSLILEEGTRFYRDYEAGRLDLVGEDLDRDMYHRTRSILKEAGYRHYEISNYGKKGYECRHNLVYWNIKPYIGLGLGSHSNYGSERFNNLTNLKSYLDRMAGGQSPVENREFISRQEEIVEYCIMGIRKIEGIGVLDFKSRFKEDIYSIYGQVIEKHRKNGLLEKDLDYIRLTEKGLDLANLVEIDFLL